MKKTIDSNFAIAILALVASCVGFAFWVDYASDNLSDIQVINTASPSAASNDTDDQPVQIADGWKIVSGDPTMDCSEMTYAGDAEIEGYLENIEFYGGYSSHFRVKRESMNNLPFVLSEKYPYLILREKGFEVDRAEDADFDDEYRYLEVGDQILAELQNSSERSPATIHINQMESYCEGFPIVTISGPLESEDAIKADNVLREPVMSGTDLGMQGEITISTNDWESVNDEEFSLSFAHPRDARVNAETGCYRVDYMYGHVIMIMPTSKKERCGARTGVGNIADDAKKNETLTISGKSYNFEGFRNLTTEVINNDGDAQDLYTYDFTFLKSLDPEHCDAAGYCLIIGYGLLREVIGDELPKEEVADVMETLRTIIQSIDLQ